MPASRHILLTGFEPFGGETLNATQELVRQFDGRRILGRRVAGRVLPVVFGRAREELGALLRELDPCLVIGLGQAGGRGEITPERVAINVDDARIPDNAGAQPIDRPIEPRGPAAYWSTLPIKAIVAALHADGIPAQVSQSAGTYVCNHVFYDLMHRLRRRPGVRGGFIHVPLLPAQAGAGQPSLPLELIARAVQLAIETSLACRADVRTAGGTEA